MREKFFAFLIHGKIMVEKKKTHTQIDRDREAERKIGRLTDAKKDRQHKLSKTQTYAVQPQTKTKKALDKKQEQR